MVADRRRDGTEDRPITTGQRRRSGQTISRSGRGTTRCVHSTRRPGLAIGARAVGTRHRSRHSGGARRHPGGGGAAEPARRARGAPKPHRQAAGCPNPQAGVGVLRTRRPAGGGGNPSPGGGGTNLEVDRTWGSASSWLFRRSVATTSLTGAERCTRNRARPVPTERVHEGLGRPTAADLTDLPGRPASVRQAHDPHQAHRHRRRAPGRSGAACRLRQPPEAGLGFAYPCRRGSDQHRRQRRRPARTCSRRPCSPRPERPQPGERPGQDIKAARAQTDAAVAAFLSSLSRLSDSDQAVDLGLVQAAQTQLGFMGDLRSQADAAQQRTWQELTDQFFDVEDAVVRVGTTAFGADISNPTLAAGIQNLAALTNYKSAVAREGTLLTGAMSTGTFTPNVPAGAGADAWAAFQSAAADAQVRLAVFTSGATPTAAQAAPQPVRRQRLRPGQRHRRCRSRAGTATRQVTGDPVAFRQAVTSVLGTIRTLESDHRHGAARRSANSHASFGQHRVEPLHRWRPVGRTAVPVARGDRLGLDHQAAGQAHRRGRPGRQGAVATPGRVAAEPRRGRRGLPRRQRAHGSTSAAGSNSPIWDRLSGRSSRWPSRWRPSRRPCCARASATCS